MFCVFYYEHVSITLITIMLSAFTGFYAFTVQGRKTLEMYRMYSIVELHNFHMLKQAETIFELKG